MLRRRTAWSTRTWGGYTQVWIGSSGIARPRRLPVPRQESGLLIQGHYCRPSGRGRRAGSLAEGSRGNDGGAAPPRWGG
ncbi:unnamed protein product, partial [Ectocarpus sp. 12 AP-2014]